MARDSIEFRALFHRAGNILSPAWGLVFPFFLENTMSIQSICPATKVCALLRKPTQPSWNKISQAHRVQVWGWKEKLYFALFG